MGPMGAVSSTRETASTRVVGSCAKRARACARCCARSPRFDPRAMYTRSPVTTLRYVGESASQVTQHRGHLLEVARCALEVGQTFGGLHGPCGAIVRLRAVLPRD